MALPKIADSPLESIADHTCVQAGAGNIKVMGSTFALQRLIQTLLRYTWF